MPGRLLATEKHPRSPAEWALDAIATTLAVINVGLGLTLVLGNEARTAGASFERIRSLMPMPWWGFLLVAAGLVALACQHGQRPRLMFLAHVVAGVTCSLWAVSFLITAWHNILISGTGVWAYAALAACHLCVAATARRE